jgi:hypothetical protein
MISQALEAGAPFGWFTADEVHEQASGCRPGCKNKASSFVLTIGCGDTVTMEAARQGRCCDGATAECWIRRASGGGF